MTYQIAFTDPETGKTEILRPRLTTLDQRLDRIIELLELIATTTFNANASSVPADIAADVVRILNEKTGGRR